MRTSATRFGRPMANGSPTTPTRPGENELYVRSQDGKGQPQQITSNADTYYYQPIWSPDSKKLLWSDRLQRLRYVDVASKAITQVDQDKEGEIAGYDWSPDSQWIAWSRPEENGCDKVYLFSTADKKTTRGDRYWYSAGNATFSDDGKYLMLVFESRFQPDLRRDRFLQSLSRHGAGLSRYAREGYGIAARPAQRRSRQEEGQRQG